MAQITADRIKETSTTTGTGNFTLGGTVTGFQAFSAVMVNNDTCYYCIDGGAEWEIGLGTWTTGGILVRLAAQVYSGSSGAGVLVNFSAGAKVVFLDAPARQLIDSLVSVDITTAGTNLSGTTYTLDVTQHTRTIFEFTGTLTADWTIIIPPYVKRISAENLTTGAYNLTLKTPSGTGVTWDPSTKTTWGLYINGTNVEPANNFDLRNNFSVWNKAQVGIYSVLTDATTIAMDLSLANNFELVLGGNRILGTPTNIIEGQSGVIDIYQDITGGRTLAFSWAWNFPGRITPTLSPGSLVKDKIVYETQEYFSSTATITIASPAVITQTGHGYVSGYKIQFTTLGYLPTGLLVNVSYYVTVIDANTYYVSSSLGNAQTAVFVTTSNSQSGTHTATNASILASLVTLVS
jgi:hypothetical protein